MTSYQDTYIWVRVNSIKVLKEHVMFFLSVTIPELIKIKLFYSYKTRAAATESTSVAKPNVQNDDILTAQMLS